MLHVEADHVEAPSARQLDQPRLGNAINARGSNKVTTAQFSSNLLFVTALLGLPVFTITELV
jgi:hypothetical protein